MIGARGARAPQDLDAEGDQKLCNGSLGVVGPPPTSEESQLALEAKLGELDQAVEQLREQMAAGGADDAVKEALLARVDYYESYRTRLQAWVRNDPSAGGEALRVGGCLVP